MAFLRPGAGKLSIIKIAKNGCFWGSPKSRPGRLLGGHFGDFFNIDFSVFLGAPKTLIFDDPSMKKGNLGVPEGTAIKGQNRPFLGPPFWPAKTAPGGVPKKPKLEVWRFGPKTRPGDVISPGVAGGVPGDPGGSLGKASERLISQKKKETPDQPLQRRHIK